MSRRLTRAIRIVTLIAVASLLPPAASAQVTTFNNFGPGDAFSPSSWFAVGPDLAPSFDPQWVAMDFKPSVTGDFASLRMALDGVTNFHPLHVRMTDNLDWSLSTWNLEWVLDSDDWVGPPTDLDLGGGHGPTLFTGKTYFVEASAEQDEILAWHLSPNPDIGNVYFSENEGTSWNKMTNARSAFRVEVFPAAVPEASSVTLFLAGGTPLGLLWWRQRRSRKAP